MRLLAQVDIGKIDGVGNFVPKDTGAGSLESAFAIENLLSMIVGFLTVVGGLSFLIYFIIGAINWITAGGDEKKVDTAKSYMTNGAVGMIIIVAATSIIWIVGEVLGFKILNPSQTLPLNYTPSSGTSQETQPTRGGPQE